MECNVLMMVIMVVVVDDDDKRTGGQCWFISAETGAMSFNM